jgi:CDP-glucose 4,6-dehydratase
MSLPFAGSYTGRRVFLTGHTGFKGAWLGFWLARLGAEVTGYALEPPTQPSMFAALGLGECLRSVVADVRDRDRLTAEMRAAQPSVVFHLAAQAIVRTGYADPQATYETNVMGTVNLLDAVRACDTVEAVVIVTSDKCYLNMESGRSFQETDPMGGRDPYSSSKGCVELVTAAYRASFFDPAGDQRKAGRVASVASVRAGNVIGGGDWAVDRIIPDCVRALSAGAPIVVRNPRAVRPWQHVLEPLSGYLWLAALMLRDRQAYGGAWNFGPGEIDNAREVRWVVDKFLEEWGEGEWTTPRPERPAPHEAVLLSLDSSKARDQLGWRPVWNAPQAVRHTAAWYRDYYEATAHGKASGPSTATLRELTSAQLAAYAADACSAGLVWAASEVDGAEPEK